MMLEVISIKESMNALNSRLKPLRAFVAAENQPQDRKRAGKIGGGEIGEKNYNIYNENQTRIDLIEAQLLFSVGVHLLKYARRRVFVVKRRHLTRIFCVLHLQLRQSLIILNKSHS